MEENRALLLLERAGQISCTVLVLIFRDFDPKWQGVWTLWLAASVLCMGLYLACWVRYFTGGRRMADFCRPLLGVPVPLASLPTAAFLLLAVYGRVVWLGLAAPVLGVGHIGVTLQYWRAVKARG